ncbi:MAG TPA: tetratricopeptide repeat protein, partial [Chthoniobacteraceae bacterium]|nr:tetratricopeptide repeat protein [Chthoniobacteraceae bacterium]
MKSGFIIILTAFAPGLCAQAQKQQPAPAQETATVIFARALDEQRKGDFAAAKNDYDKIIVLEPTNATAFGNRGNAKLASGDFDGAMSDLNRAIQLQPISAPCYYNRANAWETRGDLDAALLDYN